MLLLLYFWLFYCIKHDRTHSVKFLGVIFDNNLNFKELKFSYLETLLFSKHLVYKKYLKCKKP